MYYVMYYCRAQGSNGRARFEFELAISVASNCIVKHCYIKFQTRVSNPPMQPGYCDPDEGGNPKPTPQALRKP